MQQIKVATLKTAYLTIPSGTNVTLGEKIKSAGFGVYYECFNSIHQSTNTSMGLIPQKYLNIL